jgi:hypothetical protein
VVDVTRNNATLTVTGSSGTTGPSGGTSETWAVAALPVSFGAALGASETLRLVDSTAGASVGQQAEIVLLTASTGSGATSITVTRGAEGTTPVPHSAGATFAAVITKAVLDRLTIYRTVTDVDLTGSYDVSAAIQAALDRAGEIPVFLPPGIYKISSPLQLNPGQTLLGHGLGGAGTNQTILRFYGGATADAIVMKGTNQSRVNIEGLRIEDARTGATGGCAINLQFVYNIVRIHRIAAMGWAGDAIQVGAASGNSSDCVDINDLWVSSARYGLNLNRIDNLCLVRNIKGDSLAAETVKMTSLIFIDHIQNSNVAISIEGAKLETDTGCHVLQLGSTMYGNLDAVGLQMRGLTSRTGGDVVRVENSAPETLISVRALGSGNFAGGAAVAANMVNDVGNGLTYGHGIKTLARWTRSYNIVESFIAGVFTAPGLGGSTITGLTKPAIWNGTPNVTGTIASAANAFRGTFIWVGQSITVSKMRIYVRVASGNISGAIYTASGGSRLATTGSVACPGAGIANLSLTASVTLTPGVYFTGLSTDNTTATVACLVAGQILGGAQTTTAHPAPASVSVDNDSAGQCPVVGLY